MVGPATRDAARVRCRIDLSHEVLIASTPAAVYGLVSDVVRMGEFSPECLSCTWTAGAPGSVGSRFVGHDRVGSREWEMECEVTVATPSSAFGWTVLTEAISRETSVWRFDVKAVDSGTHLLQTFKMNQPPSGLQRILDTRTAEEQARTIDFRRRRLDQGMRVTLAAIKATAERQRIVSP